MRRSSRLYLSYYLSLSVELDFALAEKNGIVRFRGEKIIELKRVMGLDLFDERPSYRKVKYWVKYGIGGVKLESRREGGRIKTSVEAVTRFLQRINGDGL